MRKGTLRGQGEAVSRRPNQKLKILYLRQMLLEQTDDEYGLSMAQIIANLAELGIPAERKAIYRDLDSLREFGMDIIKRANEKTGVTEYAIGKRDFEFPELLLLVDAVQSSRFLTTKKCMALVESIRKLASSRQGKDLMGRVHVDGRIKMQNESVYYNINDIQQAISRRRKITFCYRVYDLEKNSIKRKDGRTYVENPVCLIYSNDFYYLITFNDKHETFVTYRVDRMCNIKVSDEMATRNEQIASFDPDAHVAQTFGMFGGQLHTVEIEFGSSSVGSFIDRFGKGVDMTRIDAERALVRVEVAVGGTFFAWLAQFGTDVRIVGPDEVAERYVSFLKEITGSYETV